MYKYSLILLGAVGLFIGCDGDCCQEEEAVVVPINVKPVVTRVLGEVGNSTTTCVTGNTITLSANGSDTNGNLDSNSYSYTVGGVANTTGTVNCPATGETSIVCATVKDEDGLVSDEVCVTIREEETEPVPPVAASCVPSITAMDTTGNVADSLTAGDNYTFDNNVTGDICAATECTWSVKSLNSTGGYYSCLIENSHVGTDDEATDPHHVTLDSDSGSANIAIRTCASNYVQIEIDLNCTNPAVNVPKTYPLIQP